MAIRILGDLDLQEAVSALGNLLDLETGYCTICGVVVVLRKSSAERVMTQSKAPPGPPVQARAEALPGSPGEPGDQRDGGG
jgi:hypothetical protein